MKTTKNNSISHFHKKLGEESFGRIKKTYRRPTFLVGYYESLVFAK